MLAQAASPPRMVVIGTNPVMFTRPLRPGRYTPMFLNPWGRLQLYLDTDSSTDLTYFSRTARESYLLVPSLRVLLGGATGEPVRIVERVDHGYLANVRAAAPVDLCKPNRLPHRSVVPAQEHYLEALLTELSSAKVPTIIAHLPQHPCMSRKLKRAKYQARMRRTVRKLGAAAGAQIVDLGRLLPSGSLPDGSWLNAEHVNVRGARVVSACLSAVLCRKAKGLCPKTPPSDALPCDPG